MAVLAAGCGRTRLHVPGPPNVGNWNHLLEPLCPTHYGARLVAGTRYCYHGSITLSYVKEFNLLLKH